MLGAILLLMTLVFGFMLARPNILPTNKPQPRAGCWYRPLLPGSMPRISKVGMQWRNFKSATENPGGQEGISEYKYKFVKPKAKKSDHKPEGEELAILNKFLNDPSLNEETRRCLRRELSTIMVPFVPASRAWSVMATSPKNERNTASMN